MAGELLRLHAEQGQSPWLDNLQRRMLGDGSLDDLIRRGVRGLTSNPTIFQKAIQGSADYDGQFGSLVRAGVAAADAYWDLVISDIREAAHKFAPVHAASGGIDGHVSVEVDPRLAHETDATVRAARDLRERVNEPNVMIKIPATVEGLPAIRSMIAEGCNVNVTLIFSLARYAEVMEAFVSGLEDRVSAGMSPAGIASVASFFISRVDSEIDPRLESTGGDEALALRGTAAVNQAKLAYALFRRFFSGERWESLAAAGATVQRPLWASTSTKNPAYPDTLYVDSLIGPDTVNTLPDPTLDAFDDHGTPARTIDSGIDLARSQWDRLATLGIDVDDVSWKLEREGVASFVRSFEELLTALESKASAMGTV